MVCANKDEIGQMPNKTVHHYQDLYHRSIAAYMVSMISHYTASFILIFTVHKTTFPQVFYLKAPYS